MAPSIYSIKNSKDLLTRRCAKYWFSLRHIGLTLDPITNNDIHTQNLENSSYIKSTNQKCFSMMGTSHGIFFVQFSVSHVL